MSLVDVREGDDWWSISQRTGIPILQLRLHNPFLATRALHVGQVMAVPPSPRTDLFLPTGDDLELHHAERRQLFQPGLHARSQPRRHSATPTASGGYRHFRPDRS